MTTKSLILVSGLLLLVPQLSGCNGPEETPAERFSRRMAESGNTRFHLRGQVVDPNGQPVVPEKVNVILTGYAPTKRAFGDTGKEKWLQDEPDENTFNYRFDGWSTAQLTFIKPGYYKTHESFSARSLAEAADKVLAGETERPPEVAHEDLTIVMHRKPTDVPVLIPYSSLIFSPSGPDRATDFDAPADETRKGMEVEASDPSTWPDNGVVLLADVTVDGKIDVARKPDVHPDMPDADYIRGLRLVMTGEGGGFRRFEPQKYTNYGAWKLVYREMAAECGAAAAMAGGSTSGFARPTAATARVTSGRSGAEVG